MSFSRSFALCILLLTCPAFVSAQDAIEPPAPATPRYTIGASKKAMGGKPSADEKDKKDTPDDKPKRKKGKRKNQDQKSKDKSESTTGNDKKMKKPVDPSKSGDNHQPAAKPKNDDMDAKGKTASGDQKQSGKKPKKNDKPAGDKKKKAPQKHPKHKKAYTSLDYVDEDFAFQGEFTGDILPDDTFDTQGQQQIGLQVVAMGDGHFQAIRYPNGLPGQSWFSGYKENLTGTREGDVLTLTGDDTKIEISNNRAIVRSKTGNLLGEFLKAKRTSPTLGAKPPSNAIVLFDGTTTDKFKNGKILEDGSLKMGTEFVDGYQDFTLHLEFMLPYMPHARGQGRSNSGVYMASRYEVQILDSFGLTPEFNHCGALYRYQKPNVNMCLPPLTWQTYDITFFSPKFDADGKKTQNGVLTVLHNGIKIHDNFQVERKTGAGKPEGPDALPTKLQDHGNPVKFRNIWLVDHSNNSASESPYVAQSSTISAPVSETYYPPIAPIEYQYPESQSIIPDSTVTYPIYDAPLDIEQ